MQLASEQALQDIPSAIVTYYSDSQSAALPALAIAIGSNVFIYRNLRPYYKFALPKEVVHEEEKTIWYDTCAVADAFNISHQCTARSFADCCFESDRANASAFDAGNLCMLAQ